MLKCRASFRVESPGCHFSKFSESLKYRVKNTWILWTDANASFTQLCSLEFYSCMDLKCPQMLCHLSLQKVELSECGLDFVTSNESVETMVNHSVDQVTKCIVFLPGCLLVPSLCWKLPARSEDAQTDPRRMALVGEWKPLAYSQ